MAIDLKAAEPFCTGLALDKLHHEMQLIGNQKIDANTRKPVVHYKLTAERDATDHIEFLFRATIDVPEGGTFNELVDHREQGRRHWKVSNFDDYEIDVAAIILAAGKGTRMRSSAPRFCMNLAESR